MIQERVFVIRGSPPATVRVRGVVEETAVSKRTNFISKNTQMIRIFP
jgi:hypothetical protein